MRNKVLFVDDESNLLEGIKRTLRNEPYEVLTATSTDDVYDILFASPIDLIVCDLEMPVTPGVELLASVHKNFPEMVKFVLTGRPTLGAVIEAVNRGAINQFLTKPCDPAHLAISIRQALGHKNLKEEARRLLEASRQQSTLIECLERENPGITKVHRDASGAILIHDVPMNEDQFMQEIHEQIDKADKQLKHYKG